MRRDQESIDMEAFRFWSEDSDKRRDFSHICGSGRWSHGDTWIPWGWRHRDLFRKLRDRHHVRNGPMKSMLEWGPGGGANVVAFADEGFERIVGADISALNLSECVSQCDKRCPGVFEPRLLSPLDHPNTRINPVACGMFDFYLNVAVIQHMPSHESVRQCMSAAAGVMREAGQALVQFRIPQRIRRFRLRNYLKGRGRYAENIARWCLFDPEEFVKLCDETGWHVLQVVEDDTYSSGYMYVYLERK